MNKSKLFIVFNRAKAKARNDVKLLQRIYKAFKILQSKDYYQDEKALYNPSPVSCGCKDWEFRHSVKRGYAGHCCHMIAEILMDRISKVTYQQMDFYKQ